MTLTMDIPKLTAEEVIREAEATVSEQELNMVPKSQRKIFMELRRTNGLMRWMVSHQVMLNNVVSDHEKQLNPLRVFGRFLMGLFAALAGIVAVIEYIKHK